jgi:hypothetical protein
MESLLRDFATGLPVGRATTTAASVSIVHLVDSTGIPSYDVTIVSANLTSIVRMVKGLYW